MLWSPTSLFPRVHLFSKELTCKQGSFSICPRGLLEAEAGGLGACCLKLQEEKCLPLKSFGVLLQEG